MQLAEIRVADLPEFVGSSLWHQLSPKPLTILRAISQFENPRANPDDLALLIAFENDQLTGLVGLLPDWVNGQPGQVASSNSCWWAHPEKGKQIAIPLFLRAFAMCNQRMFMTDCTPHTLSILEKTNWFDFPVTATGVRGFLKFNLHEILPAKFPSVLKLKPLLKFTDQMLNLLYFPIRKFRYSRVKKGTVKTEYHTSLNQELYAFIEKNSRNEFTRRSGKELEWIIQFPWIKGKNGNEQVPFVEYPFSYIVDSFEQYFVKVTKQNQTTGLLLISVRDGHMKVPYAWFQEKDALQILKVIYQQAVLKNVVTLTLFNPKLVNRMNSVYHPFIFRKKIARLIAVSKQLTAEFNQYPDLQDGDGDVVFT